MFVRGRYGHGARLGYEKEWRMQPAISGGGELVDQGMHLLDLSYAILGDVPLHSALLRNQFWTAPVEDNAALLLGAAHDRSGPWAQLHVTWTEWKNLFSLEIMCRTGKLQVDGLARSYGPQVVHVYTMSPEMGPPAIERIEYAAEDVSWRLEWEHLRDGDRSRRAGKPPLRRRPALGALRLAPGRGRVRRSTRAQSGERSSDRARARPHVPGPHPVGRRFRHTKKKPTSTRSTGAFRVVLDGLGLKQWEIIFAMDPSPDLTEQKIVELNALRRAGAAGADVATVRPARGDDRRHDRRRPVTPSWSSTATCRTRPS